MTAVSVIQWMRVLRIALWWGVALGALAALPCAAFADDLPWRVGDTLPDGSELSAIQRHPEFVRLAFENAGQRNSVEIGARPPKDQSPFASAHYRVQPAPGSNPPEALLRAIRDRLLQMEAESPDHTRLVVLHEAPPEPKAQPALLRFLEARASVVLLGGLLVLLLFGGAGVWLAFRRRRVARTAAQPRAKVRLLLFWLIGFAPLIVVAVVLGALALSVIKVNAIDERAFVARWEARLAAKSGRPFLPVEREGRMGFFFGSEFTPEGEGERFQSLQRLDNERLIWVFGGSSVVIPGYDVAFPKLLEDALNAQGASRYRTVNLGVPGYDSFSILNRAMEGLKHARPDLAIIYTGHNDITSLYRDINAEDLALVRNSAVLDSLVSAYFHGIYAPLHGLFGAHVRHRYEGFVLENVERRLFSGLERVGAISLEREMFDRVDAAALSYFRRNITAMLDAFARLDVPVLLITPIANLHFDAVGVNGDAEHCLASGLVAKNYAERLRLLRCARDRDVIGTNRVKSPLVACLRGISRPGVWVYDLETELSLEGFEFDGHAFMDSVHFNEAMHENISKRLMRFLSRTNWVARPQPPSDEPATSPR